MFICGLCNKPSKPGDRMFKVPDRARPAVHGVSGPQIAREAKLCPPCAVRYRALVAEVAPGVNPQSAYAALLK